VRVAVDTGTSPEVQESANASVPAREEPRIRAPGQVVWISALLYALVSAYFSIRRHDSFLSGFDLANFDQAFWLLAHGHEPLITQSGRLFWGDHFGLTTTLLTPLYVIGAGPRALLVVQSITMAAVAPLLFSLARAYGARPWIAALPPMLWLMSPLTLIPNVYEFHHVPFVAPAIVGSVLALKRDRMIWFAILALLACGGKEDVPLIYLALGVVVAMEGRRRLGALISASALGIFGFAVVVFIPHFSNSQSWFAKRFAGDRGDSLGDVAVWLVSHPISAMADLFEAQNILVFAAVVFTTGGLCLLAPRWMLLGAPALAHNLLSAYQPQHALRDQYYVPVSLSFSIAAAAGVHRLVHAGRPIRLLATVCIAASFASFGFGVLWAYGVSDWKSRHVDNGAAAIAARQDILARIPPDAPVAASSLLTPHLSHRTEIYTLPLPFIWADFGSDWSRKEMARRARRVRWVVLDTSERPMELPRAPELLVPILQRLGFHEIDHRGTVRLFMRSKSQ
jgi:uncharacterized membrane protein